MFTYLHYSLNPPGKFSLLQHVVNGLARDIGGNSEKVILKLLTATAAGKCPKVRTDKNKDRTQLFRRKGLSDPVSRQLSKA